METITYYGQLGGLMEETTGENEFFGEIYIISSNDSFHLEVTDPDDYPVYEETWLPVQ